MERTTTIKTTQKVLGRVVLVCPETEKTSSATLPHGVRWGRAIAVLQLMENGKEGAAAFASRHSPADEELCAR